MHVTFGYPDSRYLSIDIYLSNLKVPVLDLISLFGQNSPKIDQISYIINIAPLKMLQKSPKIAVTKTTKFLV